MVELADTRDRHVRRTGAHYAEALAALLPTGLAWPRERTSVLRRVVEGLAGIWGYVDGRAADLLERETDPRRTIDLLPEWETAFGLPDPCLTPTTRIDRRRKLLLQRMTLLGGQSREFFISVARDLGYTIDIREYAPFMCGVSRCGIRYDDTGLYYRWQLGPPENRFYWRVRVHNPMLTWFRTGAGRTGIDPLLDIGYAEDLECILDRIKPGHTDIIYDYSLIGPNFEVPTARITITPFAPTRVRT